MMSLYHNRFSSKTLQVILPTRNSEGPYFFYYSLAFVGAAVATYFAFRWIYNAFRSGKLKYFGLYCLLVGLVSILLYIVR